MWQQNNARAELTDLMELLSAPLRLGSVNLKKKVSNEVDWLFDVYKRHTGHQPMCGGAQNLVLGRADPHSANDSNSYFQRPLTYDDLPNFVQLYILSLMAPADLCRVCQVSRKWKQLASDELVWRRILCVRSRRWLRIHDDRNPDFFKQVCPNMDSKQIYLKCHPQTFIPGTFRLPNFFQLLSSSRPRVIMFGPGLEGGESSIVRSILTDTFPDLRHRFEVTGMVPGLFAGVGSGISLRFAGFGFNLVTLYSNVKSVRQDVALQTNRVDHNKLFVRGGDMLFEVSASVQELCRKTAAFIYVVDATAPYDQLSNCQSELFAMCCEMWSPSSAPLLVVGASGLGTHQPLPAIDILRALRLGRLKRKWMVQSTDIETLAGFRGGIDWLLSHLH